MKNFKLLLATTAILSTGALMANAAVGDEIVVSKGSNVTITPSVDIITPLDVDNEDMYFGTLISPKKDDTVIINNYSGVADGTATLVDKVIGNSTQSPKAGILDVTSGGSTVNGYNVGYTFPTSIDLKNGDTKCGTVTGIELVTFHGNGIISYGGTFTVTADDLPAGKCSGEGTVTVILDNLVRDYGTPTGGSN